MTNRQKTTMLVIGLVAVAAAGCGGSASEKLGGKSKSNVVSDSTPARTPTSTTTSSKKGDLAIVEKGFTLLPPDSMGNAYVSYAVVLKNNARDKIAERIELTVAFTDAAGKVITADTPNVGAILPGQSAAATTFSTRAPGAATMTVQANVSTWEQITKKFGTFTPSGVTTTSDRYSMKTVGMLASSFSKDLKQVQASAVFKNAAGEIIGGASTFVNFIPANASTAFEISGFQVVPDIASTDVYASVSSLTLAELG